MDNKALIKIFVFGLFVIISIHTCISGNRNIAPLTLEGNHELKIDMEGLDGIKRYALYRIFSIGHASTKYQLTIINHSGNARKYNKIVCGAEKI